MKPVEIQVQFLELYLLPSFVLLASSVENNEETFTYDKTSSKLFFLLKTITKLMQWEKYKEK